MHVPEEIRKPNATKPTSLRLPASASVKQAWTAQQFCWPGMLLNSSSQDVGFICPLVVIDPYDLGATTAVARNLLQD